MRLGARPQSLCMQRLWRIAASYAATGCWATQITKAVLSRRRRCAIWPHFAKHPIQCAEYKVSDASTIAKTHLMLGWMHVYIYMLRPQIEKEYEHGMTTMKHHIAIGLANCMPNNFVSNTSTVDIEELLIRETTVMLGEPDPAM